MAIEVTLAETDYDSDDSALSYDVSDTDVERNSDDGSTLDEFEEDAVFAAGDIVRRCFLSRHVEQVGIVIELFEDEKASPLVSVDITSRVDAIDVLIDGEGRIWQRGHGSL